MILTLDEYLNALERNFRRAKDDLATMTRVLSKRNFLAFGAAAWDRARDKYGPECDLMTRDLRVEAGQEIADGITYLAVDLEKRARGL